VRVLVLATRFHGPGGVEAYARVLASALVNDGAEVEVLSLLAGEAFGEAGPGRYLGDQGRASTAWTHGRLLLETIRRGRRYDLIVCAHVAVAPLGALVRRMLGTPYLVVAHGIEVWDALSWARRAALCGACRVIAVSHFTARRLVAVQGIPQGRVHVVHPCVDPALPALAGSLRASAATECVTLLTVARLSSLERYKGCDTVIRVLPRVTAGSANVRYVIVGDGDDRPRLEALARRCGVEDRVAFAGRADRLALAAHYQASDVYVMPSVTERRPGGWAGEGFGFAYIEAASFGRPVVAGNGGGAPEAVWDGVTGFVVDGRDPDAVAAALVRLTSDADLRRRMGEAGRAWARAYFSFERFRRDVRETVAGATGAAQPA
jgi:phosphatidylinositol alpha-1,6-mannosyltransferase